MANPIGGDQVRGHLEAMILSVLEQQPGHGFDIVKRLDNQGCGLLRLKEGTVYPVLYRLEQAGLVKAHWDDSETSRRGPRRRIYALTTKGKRQLQAGRQAWTQFVSVVGSILGAPA